MKIYPNRFFDQVQGQKYCRGANSASIARRDGNVEPEVPSPIIFNGLTIKAPNRVLKNVMSAGKTRQDLVKKRSLFVINEHFEPNFNAVLSSTIVFQQHAKGFQPFRHLLFYRLFQIQKIFFFNQAFFMQKGVRRLYCPINFIISSILRTRRGCLGWPSGWYCTLFHISGSHPF